MILCFGCDCEAYLSNTHEVVINKNNLVDPKNELQVRFALLGGIIGCIEKLVVIGWIVGIQLT